MDYVAFKDETSPASVSISRFRGPDGVDEYQLVARPLEYASVETQMEWLRGAYERALGSLGLDSRSAILRRFFCSDLANQAAVLKSFPFADPCNIDEPCAVSRVGQSPIPPAKVALWAYHAADPSGALDKSQDGASMTLHRNGLSHHWTTGVRSPKGDTSYDQTRGLFDRYNQYLGRHSLSLADHVIRTWLFVQDVDANYGGLVTARRELFADRGLTPETHYIASSGIGGGSDEPAVKVFMDAYAISGVRSEQIEFLKALDRLSPTHLYGVTFERGTSVAYRDRKHIFISGTASIDAEGQIAHTGDVSRQLDRTIENIDALLSNSGAGLKDMCAFIVYIRDPSDHAVVAREMRDRFGDAPVQLVTAPVCRPGWLVEIEGQAIIPASNPELPKF
jgi:enamine deaminase RidA (YjgF/YER057c/UK114 family)